MLGAAVTFTATWTNAVSGSGTAACVPASGSDFPVGSTIARARRRTRQETRAGHVTVTVSDTKAPIVTEAATPTKLLWSPNKTMTPVAVSGRVSDVSRIATMTYRVLDEYGYNQPSGTIVPAADGSYSFTVLLEAWRKGTDKSGRIFTIEVTATDAYGNKASASTVVTVPHS